MTEQLPKWATQTASMFSFNDGKYTYARKHNGDQFVTRSGESQCDITGDKALLLLATEIEKLRDELYGTTPTPTTSEDASELDRLRAQNAKLLAALKLSEVYIDLQTSDPRNAKLARQDLATVRAALSEAKGED